MIFHWNITLIMEFLKWEGDISVYSGRLYDKHIDDICHLFCVSSCLYYLVKIIYEFFFSHFYESILTLVFKM